MCSFDRQRSLFHYINPQRRKEGKGKRYVECPIHVQILCVCGLCAETKVCVCIEWKQDSSFDGTSMANWEKAKMLFSFGLKNFPHKRLVNASLFSLSQFPQYTYYVRDVTSKNASERKILLPHTDDKNKRNGDTKLIIFQTE